jgi:hypothetical protein
MNFDGSPPRVHFAVYWLENGSFLVAWHGEFSIIRAKLIDTSSMT